MTRVAGYSKNRANMIYSLWMAFLIIITAFFMTLIIPPKGGQAAPFTSCNSNGILFQYPSGSNTQVHLIDMASGNDSQPVGTPIANRHINAAGYNVRDHFLYGWDNTAGSLVRIHADWSVENLTVTGLPALSSPSIIIGDVDENGLYWFIDGNGASNGQNYYAIDVTVPGTTVTIADSGTTSGIPASHNAGADWAYVPGGNGLYRVMHDTVNDQGRLLVFNRATGAFSSVGLIPQSQMPHGSTTEGAFYADAAGYLYGSNNSNGNIYRIDVGTATAAFFAAGPASGSNDGARCVDAAVHVDYGDAPSSYGTDLTADGARHSVSDYIEASHTAPLMLGKKIDTENDGFPGTGANGDNNNNINDEVGVQHIVATPGDPIPVPVYVTNDTAQQATLAGWIDADNDGTFETGERVTRTIAAGHKGHVELNFGTANANTFARFRLFSGNEADPQPTGPAATAGGEVEDYLVQVGSYDISKTANPTEGSMVASGDTITYTLTLQNTGVTNLVDLTIHDNLSDVIDDANLVGAPIVNPSSAGTATVEDNILEFRGNTITPSQIVTVTYSVKIRESGLLGNTNLHNVILATHSESCHPDISGSTTSVSDPDCQTTHTVDHLANTGTSIFLPLALVTVLFGGAGVASYAGKRIPKAKQ